MGAEGLRAPVGRDRASRPEAGGRQRHHRLAAFAHGDAAEPLRAYGSKAERIYDALRLEFVHGAWPFGQTFTTYELAERFGVSRRPVMDAVQRLQSDGFVEVIPQVGCRVVVPDERRLHDHLELSMILEPPAARMAAERATVAEEEYLESLFWLYEAGLPMTGANLARAMRVSAPSASSG